MLFNIAAIIRSLNLTRPLSPFDCGGFSFVSRFYISSLLFDTASAELATGVTSASLAVYPHVGSPVPVQQRKI